MMMCNRTLMGGILATGLAWSGAHASAAFVTGFETTDDAGYVLNSVITGTDGWTDAGGGNTGTVSDVNPRSGTQHLAVAGDGNLRFYDRVINPAITGDVVITASLAMSGNNTALSLLYFDTATGATGASTAVQFGFSSGNLVYRNAGLDVVVAPWVSERYYDFTATTNFADQTYDLEIRGTDVGGTGNDVVTFSDVAFRGVGLSAEIARVRLLTNSNGNRFDVDNLSVVIPEPGSMALVGLGTLLLSGRRRGAAAKR